MADFLLELLSQEIPARMQEKACADLARLFAAEIAKAGLKADAIETYATPRRLALIARGLPAATTPTREETKGPRASAPPQALDGFLRKTGLTREDLVERDGVLFAVAERPGRAAADVLAEAIPAIVRAFPWPKSMRWGPASASTASLRWVRPLQGIVALLGEEIVPFEVDGIGSGATTYGHRFHHPGPITIGSAEDYAAKLRACHVILDPAERRGIIEGGARALAEAHGLHVVPDAGLVAENAGLTEWPVPLLGAFDPAFLDVPREVIQLTMRTNQKYFACVDGDGQLAPAFICTANIAASDGGAAIVAGNRKVLAARLADARFFWEQDLKVPLAEQAKKLSQIVFHEKLGTVADKVDRVAKLARWLVEEGIVPNSSSGRGGGAPAQPVVEGAHLPGDAGPLHQPAAGPPPRSGEDRQRLADMAEQAARLCKADLVTGMVGEFPELQGIMGGYYARAEGLPSEVADAIRDHYKPVGQGDEVPTAPVTVAVSLADKLDTLFSFFAIHERPSGSRDPFALRRAAIAIIRQIQQAETRLPLTRALYYWLLIISQLGLRWSLDDQELRSERLRHDGTAQSFALIGLGYSRRTIEVFELEMEPHGYPIEYYVFACIDATEETWLDTEIAFVLDEIILGQRYSERDALGQWVFDAPRQQSQNLLSFLADRLKVQQREAGVRHDLIDAVFALGGEDDLVRLLARVKALQAFVAAEDGANLLAGYKRAANILKKEDWSASGADAPHGEALAPAEAALVAALAQAESAAAQAVADERFEDAMAALATLRAPIDAFFEQVTVNDPDPAIRARRLDLLARIRAAVHRVADFSKIEG